MYRQQPRQTDQPTRLPRFDIIRARQVELQPPADAPLRVDDELGPDKVTGPGTATVAEGVPVLLPS